MDVTRAQARQALSMTAYGLQNDFGGIASAREYAPSAEEIAERVAEQRKYIVANNRRRALEVALGLSRFDDASHAIREARVIAEFLNLEID